MFDRFAIWAMGVLEFVFFAGLIGRAFVVLLSWMSIFSDGFTDNKDD